MRRNGGIDSISTHMGNRRMTHEISLMALNTFLACGNVRVVKGELRIKTYHQSPIGPMFGWSSFRVARYEMDTLLDEVVKSSKKLVVQCAICGAITNGKKRKGVQYPSKHYLKGVGCDGIFTPSEPEYIFSIPVKPITGKS